MVASIINAVVAEHARDRTEETARGVAVYFLGVPCLHPDYPLDELTRKRLEACLRLPTTPPAGNA